MLLQLYDNDIITRQGLVMTLLQEHGQAMTTGVISASVSALPPSMISDAAEILHELLVTDKTVRRRSLYDVIIDKTVRPTRAVARLMTSSRAADCSLVKLLQHSRDDEFVHRPCADHNSLRRDVMQTHHTTRLDCTLSDVTNKIIESYSRRV